MVLSKELISHHRVLLGDAKKLLLHTFNVL